MRENFLKIQLTLSESYFSLDDIWRDLGSRRDCSHRMHVSLALLVSWQSLPAPLREGVGIQAGCPWLVYKSQALYCHPHIKGLQLAWNRGTRYHWNAKQEDSSISNDHWQHTGSLSWYMIIFQTKSLSYRIYPSERHMSVTALEISPQTLNPGHWSRIFGCRKVKI